MWTSNVIKREETPIDFNLFETLKSHDYYIH